MRVTRDTRDRLELIATNEKPMGPRERHHGAVRAVQAALADLNRGYLRGSDVDGFYGQQTAVAVEAFQRDYGLYADGLVGKQTIGQLDGIFSANVIRPPRGMSVHIGVDRLDAGHYGGAFALSSCVNDARAMRTIAEALGYQTLTLENENATVANFMGFMRQSAAALFSGDTLLITFSGHGSQIPDSSGDAEADGLDETLCFFDRMLVDDELYSLLAGFQAGVRVIGVFDACHSGTVAKPLDLPVEEEARLRREERLRRLTDAATAYEETSKSVAVDGSPVSTVPLAESEVDEAAFAEEGAPPAPAAFLATESVTAHDSGALGLLADLYAGETTGKGKVIEFFSGIYEKYQTLYDAVRDASGPRESADVAATVVTLSACSDAQLTPAGSVYSLFTYNVVNAWASESFSGTYGQFHKALLDRSRADATPVLSTYGRSTEAMLANRPFVT
ncbi:caspase family protein [Streptomyces sp. NBC_00210]|uniref:caspase family protein n=1 Tax=unclassified Streptomyces TaxID=2593676 RepID=UPI0032504A41